jgi:chorismate mutase-like protein
MWRDDWREKLSEYRQGIDEIDLRILELVDKRMELSSRIGEIKAAYSLPVCVPEREVEVISKRQQWGRMYGLREKFVRVLFKVVMHESRRRQRELVAA